MFAMGRESFAVDTHVWRLTKALSWVPESATRDQTFNHLDLRIPGHLKFPLHTLLVLHGRSCENCSAGGIVASEKKRAIKESDCPLRSLLTESEGGGLKKKKGAKGTAKGTGKGKKRKVESDESEEEEAISSEEEDDQDSDEEEKKPKLKKLKTKAKPKPKILIKSESKSPIKKIKISESEVESELSELEDDLPSSKVVKVEE